MSFKIFFSVFIFCVGAFSAQASPFGSHPLNQPSFSIDGDRFDVEFKSDAFGRLSVTSGVGHRLGLDVPDFQYPTWMTVAAPIGPVEIWSSAAMDKNSTIAIERGVQSTLGPVSLSLSQLTDVNYGANPSTIERQSDEANSTRAHIEVELLPTQHSRFYLVGRKNLDSESGIERKLIHELFTETGPLSWNHSTVFGSGSESDSELVKWKESFATLKLQRDTRTISLTSKYDRKRLQKIAIESQRKFARGTMLKYSAAFDPRSKGVTYNAGLQAFLEKSSHSTAIAGTLVFRDRGDFGISAFLTVPFEVMGRAGSLLSPHEP